MSDADLPVVHVIKITDAGRVAYVSVAFQSQRLKATIVEAVRRLLADDTTGIAPVEFLGETGTDFFLQLLRPLADHTTVDAFLRTLSKEYRFQLEIVTKTLAEMDAIGDAMAEVLLEQFRPD